MENERVGKDNVDVSLATRMRDGALVHSGDSDVFSPRVARDIYHDCDYTSSESIRTKRRGAARREPELLSFKGARKNDRLGVSDP